LFDIHLSILFVSLVSIYDGSFASFYLLYLFRSFVLVFASCVCAC